MKAPFAMPTLTDWTMPNWTNTLLRGVCGRCPRCNQAPIFNGYLNVYPQCRVCAAPLGDMPADDTPIYIAMLIVVHVMGACEVAIVEWHVVMNIYKYAVLLFIVAAACIGALRLAKGGTIAALLKMSLKNAEPEADPFRLHRE